MSYGAWSASSPRSGGFKLPEIISVVLVKLCCGKIQLGILEYIMKVRMCMKILGLLPLGT